MVAAVDLVVQAVVAEEAEEAEALSSRRHALARTAATAVGPLAVGCSPVAPPRRQWLAPPLATHSTGLLRSGKDRHRGLCVKNSSLR